MSRIPWIGLAALIAMFVLPHVPNWLFEGPRTVKHRPRRHICADCRAPWTDGHACIPPAEILRPLRGELRRLDASAISSRPGSRKGAILRLRSPR
jgi:hypothetical protein